MHDAPPPLSRSTNGVPATCPEVPTRPPLLAPTRRPSGANTLTIERHNAIERICDIGIKRVSIGILVCVGAVGQASNIEITLSCIEVASTTT